MARIDDELIGCVFFLYPTREDAEAGAATGATGFFVGLDWSNNDQRRHVYAVTNKHCIMACRDAVVIRAITVEGTLEIIETDPVDWHPSPQHDLSVLSIQPEVATSYRNVSDGLFVSRADFKQQDDAPTCLGLGETVFMLGRFISDDGHKENHPSARFGNLSMLASPIRHPSGYDQESFAVDMRSISGYSGSPAFVYWDGGGTKMKGVGRTFIHRFFGLLGVDWGHIPIKLPVLNEIGRPLKDGSHVSSHSSMSGVVPSWHLHELLNSAHLKEQRSRDEVFGSSIR